MNLKQTKFYARKLNRYAGFDYTTSGYYYVTICANLKRHLFGQIDGNHVALSDLGKIIDKQINELAEYPNFNIVSYIIMPNHLHMLIKVNNEDCEKKLSLSDMIRTLKSKVAVEFCKTVLNKDSETVFGSIWQRSYWDYIVRKEEDLVQIDEYIRRNPEFWNEEIDNPDTEYPTNVIK